VSSKPINYMGDESILVNPYYTKWSQLTIGQVKAASTELKSDLDAVMSVYENLDIISYLATLLRVAALTA